jgi:hypothetical protein
MAHKNHAKMRIYGILAGCADQNDRDVLRHDPVFKLVAGRWPEGEHLASQPTLSRFENAVDVPSLRRLQDAFIDLFIAAFAAAPRHLTFDIDVFDDPTHGQQQLTFFHGYYDQYQYQYLPRAVTCEENDLSEAVLQEAPRKHQETGQPQRLFTALWYQAATWSHARFTIIKAEAHALVVTHKS